MTTSVTSGVKVCIKVKTTQAVITRVEGMNANPSLALFKCISAALNSPIHIHLG